MRCPVCGTPAPSGARFCGACGAALGAPGAGERRVVTVLFADLVGFTSLAERRDPEQVRGIADACLSAMARITATYGGRVDKSLGDGLLAVFGAPVAHEDDPERAVRAALRMRSEIAGLGDRFDLPLRLRVGVNTGEVLVGGVGADGYTVTGDAVNTAQRLQALAGPGEVLVGPATAQATARSIRYEHRGAVTVKGRTGPVEVAVAVEALTAPGERSRRGAPLVGRDPERDLLDRLVGASARRRTPAVALVTGDAGLGKTRLVTEVAERARCELGATVLAGRCVPYGEDNEWWAVAEAVRSALGGVPDHPAVRRALGELTDLDGDEADRTAAGLAHLLGLPGPLASVEADRARDEAGRALDTLLAALAGRSAVVVILADVHWASDRLLAMVDRAVDHLAGSPVTFLLTARPEITGRWAPRPERGLAATVPLQPLSPPDAAALVRSLSGGALPEAVVNELVDRGGGNPFFLEELVDLVVGSTDGCTIPTGLPDTLRGLVAARLDALDPTARRVVHNAAVLGRHGPVYALALMAADDGDDPAAVEAALDRLTAADIIVTDGDGATGRWRFRSDIVREVAYGTLTKADRVRRHAAVAAWLERHGRSGEGGSDPTPVIAHHWATAAELTAELGVAVPDVPDDLVARAVDWLVRAADGALWRDATASAAEAARRALGLLGPADPSRPGILVMAARAELSRHRYADAIDLARQGATAATGAGDPALAARARVVEGSALARTGRHDEAVGVLDAAIAELRRLDDDGLAAALRVRGMADLLAGEPASAEPFVAEALERYERTGDRRGEAWAQQHLAWIAYAAGRPDEAERRIDSALEAFAAIGDIAGRSWSLGLLAWVRLHQGRFAEASDLVERVLPEARRQGDRWAHAMLTLLDASIRLWTGQAPAALERASEAAELFDGAGDTVGRTGADAVRARALLATGDVATALSILEDLARTDDPTAGHPVLAAAAALVGDVGRALREADLVLAGTGAGGPTGERLGVTEASAARALGLLMSGRAATALDTVEALGPDPGPFPAAVRAMALAALGRTGEARDAAGAVDGEVGATYLDRFHAGVARVMAAVADADPDRLAGELDALAGVVGGVSDRTLAAVAAVVTAAARAAVGDPGAATARGEALKRCTLLGLDLHGWWTLFGVEAVTTG